MSDDEKKEEPKKETKNIVIGLPPGKLGMRAPTTPKPKREK